MKRPVVGVIGNSHRIENRFPVQIVGERNLRAVAEVSGAVPLMFASIPEITDVGTLLDVVDHYNTTMNLGLTAVEKSDLVEYMKSL